MMKELCVLSALVMASTMLWDGTARAQGVPRVADRNGNTLYAMQQRGEAAWPALQRPVSIDLDHVSLVRALRAIAQEANVGRAYSTDVVPEGKLVSLKIERGSVAEALRAALESTDLRVFITPRNEIVLVKARPLLQSVLAAPVLPSKLTFPPAVVSMELPGRANARKRVRQQTGAIAGVVTDSTSGAVLPGVNVVIAGTQQGAATDAEGRFRIPDVEAGTYDLVASFIGYTSARVEDVAVVSDETTVVDIALGRTQLGLEEVVVVGYGTQQRAHVTGAVASVSAEELEGIPVTSFTEALQGKVAGVRVQTPSGAPGAAPVIKVRGAGSITAGNSPLYVIDGMPMARNIGLQGTLFRRRQAFRPPPLSPLSALNTGDIASIEVLKDASAAAIYGSRGSNGVVLITTKSGDRVGAPTIQFNSYVGVQQVAHVPDLMEAEELIAYTLDSRNNNYMQKYQPESRMIPNSEGSGQILNPNYNPNWDPRTNAGRPDDDFVLIPEKYVNWDGQNTNWLDLVFSPAVMTNTNLSIRGGGENIGYYISGGYLNQEGVLDGSGYRRYTLRSNVEADPFEHLKLGANIQIAFSQQDRLPAGSPYFARPPGIVYSAMVHSPVIKPYNEEGQPNQLQGQSYLGGGTTSASNPLAIINTVDEELDMHRTFGNVYAGYEITDGLTFRTSFGADLTDYTRSFYRGNSLLYRTAKEGQPFAQSSSSRGFNWVFENTLSYDHAFGEHELTALVGVTAQAEHNDFNQVIARGFPTDAVKTLNAGQIVGGYSLAEEWALLSYLARVNYSYLGRYLLTATLRADQSSRFGENNRTGIFPSVSVGWRLSEEPFMDGASYLSNLKLRLSYGVTGNFLIPNYGSYSLLRKENYNFGAGNIVAAAAPATLGDENLTWETTRQFNAGVDVGLFEDRLYFTANYYYSRTSDLLLNVTLPSAIGYTTVLTNIGEVANEGFEFALTSRNIVGAFSWTTDLNVATNSNEVLALGPAGDPILSVGGAGIRHITRIGSPIGSYYGYVVDGVYQSKEDIANAPEDLLAPDPRPGDFRFKDVNGDGVIDEDDRTVTGSYFPDYAFGITNTFTYKGFDLSVFIQGVEGREILNLTARHLKNGEANFNSYAVLNDRWTGPGASTTAPRADRQSGIHGNNNRPSSYQLGDGSYVRIRNVTLGYRLPPSVLGNVLQQARIYVSGKNLYTLTSYIGFNPEVNNQQESALTPGEDYGAYPLSRVYTVGVNLTF